MEMRWIISLRPVWATYREALFQKRKAVDASRSAMNVGAELPGGGLRKEKTDTGRKHTRIFRG